QFREDLYYRLNVFPVTVPPLRERQQDITLLATTFLERSLQKLGRTMAGFNNDSIALLNAYDWPGNVRELQNVIERSVIVSRDGWPNLDRALPVLGRISPAIGERVERVLTVSELEELEKKNILAALNACDWKVAGDNGAAKLLAMKPSTLSSRMTALGIKKSRSV
ncbi:MAG: Fis family transcriptional regulator, partial [Blastocatellia bacterium]